MERIEPTFDGLFNFFKVKAKEEGSSVDELAFNLGIFLQKANYNRTPYQLYFEGFYRARTGNFESIDKACEEFNHVRELGPPPAKFAKECRCNTVGNPIFYCTNDNGTAVFEVRPQIGQYVVITHFKPVNSKNFEIVLPIIGVNRIKTRLERRDKHDPIAIMLRDDLIYKTEDAFIKVLDHYLSNLFIEPVSEANKYLYKLSTAYYKALVTYAKYDNDKITGLFYPSVESECTGYNLALELNAIKDKLEVDASGTTVIYKVEWKQGKEYRLRPKKQIKSIDENGNIVWEDAVATGVWHLNPSDLAPTINSFR